VIPWRLVELLNVARAPINDHRLTLAIVSSDYDVALVNPSFLYPKGVPMKVRLLLAASICTLFIFSFANTTSSAKHSNNLTMAKTQTGSPTEQKPPRDEKLWQRALEIQRKAIVIDSHNDITTPMTNDDYDLSGAPPVPYRTSIDRMKEGGLTAEFFSVYIKPNYVQAGGAARRTLDMIDFGLSRVRAPSQRSDVCDFGRRHSSRQEARKDRGTDGHRRRARD
jgi:hypothetical protein